MTDPYKVLGVSRDAGDDEIKKAYRTLSRKYHPDANINNPHKEQAEEMFKIVQQAYEQIMDERERGSSGAYGGAGASGYGSWGFGGTDGDPFGGMGGSTYGGNAAGGRRYGPDLGDPHLRAAANYINTRHFREAMNVLDGIDMRTASWHYLRAMACAGLGNNVEAREEAGQAAEMEPGNYEFRRLQQQLGGGGDWYDAMGRGYGYGGSPCAPDTRPAPASPGACCLTMALCNCCLFPYGGFCCC